MKTMTDSGRFNFARRGVAICLLLLIPLLAQPAHAQARLVVRDPLGLPGINLTCALLGCNVVRGLGNPKVKLLLFTSRSLLTLVRLLCKSILNFAFVIFNYAMTVIIRLPLQGLGARSRPQRSR